MQDRAASTSSVAIDPEPTSSRGPKCRNAAILRQSDPEQDSEQLRFAPRTWLPAGGTIEARSHGPRTIMLFRAKGRENMIADRARPRDSLPLMDPRATFFYFAAAVPPAGVTPC